MGTCVVLRHSVVSNCLRLEPAKLLCPGKNPGVGGHALLQGNLPNPGTEPRSPALHADSLPSTTREAQCKIIAYNLQSQAECCGKWKCIYVHVFICPASLCLLVGTFSPFTFKVMIDMYDPITIFLIVLGFFCAVLFLLSCFLPREVPLAFVVKLIWWCWILLTFACLDSFWFLHQIWRRVLLGKVFLVVSSSLSSL